MRSVVTVPQVVTLALVLGPVPAMAEYDFNYSLRASAGYSDNIERSSTLEESSSAFAVGGTLEYRQETMRLDADISADLDFVNYKEDFVDDQLAGNFYGNVLFGIVPEQFLWFVNNNYGQGRADLFAPSGPTNSEAINFLSTGPRGLIQLADRTLMFVEGTYSNAWYEESDGDNDQYGGALGVVRLLAGTSSVRVVGAFTRIEYADPTFASGVDLASAYVGYRSESARSELLVDAGYQQLADAGDTTGGPLLRVSLRHELTPYSSLAAVIGHEYTDSAGLLRIDQSQPGGSTSPGRFGNGRVFLNTYLGLTYSLSRARTNLRLGTRLSYEDYVGEGVDDVQRMDVFALASRSLSQYWTAGVTADYWTEDREDLNFESDEWSAGVFTRWQVSRTVSLQANWDYWHRSASISQDDSAENRYWLRVNWQPNAGRGSRISEPAGTESATPSP